MTETKHTPGPRRCAQRRVVHGFSTQPNGACLGNPSSSAIATILHGYPEHDAEVTANANLIAAAPDLLDALLAQGRMDSLQQLSGKLFWQFLGEWFPTVRERYPATETDALPTEGANHQTPEWDAFGDVRVFVCQLRQAALAKAQGEAQP